MEIKLESGFKFAIVSSKRILLVESEKIDITIKFIGKEKISSIELNRLQGYKLADVSFLTEVGELIEEITIIDDTINLDELRNVKNLKKIYIGGSNTSTINFEWFKYLESCNIFWHSKLSSLSHCKNLKELVLRKYVYNAKTLNFISGLSSLKRLTLIQNKFSDLQMLKCFSHLEELEISYNRDLKEISEIRDGAKSLVKLRIENCKNIVDYTAIGNLKELKYLAISSSADIKSLGFIRNLKNLEYLSFVGTNVLDGDLSVCIGLNYVAFDNKKHFSHTYETMKSLTSERI